jgi:hypothetical protein
MARAEGVRGLFRGMSYPIYTTALQVGRSAAAAAAAAGKCVKNWRMNAVVLLWNKCTSGTQQVAANYTHVHMSRCKGSV